MENVWIIILFGITAGVGFSLGKELINTITEMIYGIIDKLVYIKDMEDDEK